MLTNEFGGDNVYENLVTALKTDNQKMSTVEYRIRGMAARHFSVCMRFVPLYRVYIEGVGIAPKAMQVDVVTSKDRGGREEFHLSVPFEDLKGYRQTGFFSAQPEIFPLN